MSIPYSPKRFVLLVGIDKYLNNNRRKGQNGLSISVRNLNGCVNDVQMLQAFLNEHFELTKTCVLMSPPPNPHESTYRLPTFDNIKKAFDDITEEANPGDLFLFHFSGHGALLNATNDSPVGRSLDPSLLTADYCYGERAVRGWELNQWLKRLNDKCVRTLVTLDSCYSGGSWRGDGCRTPDDWTPPPNLPTDLNPIPWMMDDARGAHAEISWGMNPNGFTLMAACEPDQKACEGTFDGKHYGQFTHALCGYLQKDRSRMITSSYNMIRNRIARKILKYQNPRVFGQDNLAFFRDTELLTSVALLASIQDDTAYLPTGQLQGINKGVEFISTQKPQVILSVTEVEKNSSKAKIILRGQGHLSRNMEIIPHRWHLEKTLKIVVDPEVHSSLPKLLCRQLEKKIASKIEVKVLEKHKNHISNSSSFGLKLADGKLGVWCPASLIGQKTNLSVPVAGLDIEGESAAQQARELAIVFAHVFRFEQLLRLPGVTTTGSKTFRATLDQELGDAAHPFDEGTSCNVLVENTSLESLNVTILTLGTGFHCAQLYPQEDYPKEVPPGRLYCEPICLKVAEELKRGQGTQQQAHRDIIRVVVTKGGQARFKSIELPEIWKVRQFPEKGSSLRIPEKSGSNFSGWVQDIEIWTTPRYDT